MANRVLLVDDCSEVLYGLRQLFQKASVGIAGEAETCAAALQFVRTNAVDLILLDLNLPDGHGLQILPQLKAQQPNVPVVVHSSSDSGTDLLLSYKLGAQGYLVKGLDPPEHLLDIVQRACLGESVWTKEQLNRVDPHRIVSL